MPAPRIAIVGGGPAGLTTGLLLQKHNIAFTVFELRSKPTDEELSKPSGMLDLHDESGIAAIKECGLLDEFYTLTGECTEAQKVADRQGTILYQDEGEHSERPEISRHALTRMLMSHLSPDKIQWERKLVSATTTTNASGHTETELDFGPHGKHTFDLVIGADGTWSKIRRLLTDVKPAYEGTQCITATITNATEKYPHLDKLVGKGSFSALGNRHGVMSQRGPQDSMRIYIFVHTDDENFAKTNNLAGNPATVAKKNLLESDAVLGTWGSVMKELVSTACDEESVDNPGAEIDVRGLYNLPIGQSWEHKPGATVIGDASHVMGPWAGEGVNLAMWDSLLLAKTIVKAHEISGQDEVSFQKTLDPLMTDFEADMAMRAKEKAEESKQNGEMMFGEDGANAFVAFFRSFMPE